MQKHSHIDDRLANTHTEHELLNERQRFIEKLLAELHTRISAQHQYKTAAKQKPTTHPNVKFAFAVEKCFEILQVLVQIFVRYVDRGAHQMDERVCISERPFQSSNDQSPAFAKQRKTWKPKPRYENKNS